MTSHEELENIRRTIAQLASSRTCRRVGWESQWKLPSDWSPRTVIQPESGMPFTPVGAWELIAELALEGHPMQEIQLDIPPAEIAYQFLVDLAGASTTLYIKVHVKGGILVGRSFHYSERRGLHGYRRRGQGALEE